MIVPFHFLTGTAFIATFGLRTGCYATAILGTAALATLVVYYLGAGVATGRARGAGAARAGYCCTGFTTAGYGAGIARGGARAGMAFAIVFAGICFWGLAAG